MIGKLNKFLFKVTHEAGGYSIVFDDDGRVSYAYLLNSEGDIVSDVWLYNRVETPAFPEWEHREKMPFLNPQTYVRTDMVFQPIGDASQVNVGWELVDNKKPQVSIFIRGNLFAKLMDGARPGWSLLAAKDGPLANVLVNK